MSKLRVDEIEDTQGNPFDLSPSNVTTLTGTQTVAGALDQRVVYEKARLTVLIPSDYPTLQEAFDNLANIKVGQGEIIDLVIESGHALTSGVRLDNGYYKNFRISSQDERVEVSRSEEHTSELQSRPHLVCRLLLEKKKKTDA